MLWFNPTLLHRSWSSVYSLLCFQCENRPPGFFWLQTLLTAAVLGSRAQTCFLRALPPGLSLPFLLPVPPLTPPAHTCMCEQVIFNWVRSRPLSFLFETQMNQENHTVFLILAILLPPCFGFWSLRNFGCLNADVFLRRSVCVLYLYTYVFWRTSSIIHPFQRKPHSASYVSSYSTLKIHFGLTKLFTYE